MGRQGDPATRGGPGRPGCAPAVSGRCLTAMCNDYANYIPWADFVHVFGGLGMPIVAPTAAPNLEPREDIRPTDKAPRSDERRVGKECVSTCRSRLSQYH